jgi:MOB kinase activator 1
MTTGFKPLVQIDKNSSQQHLRKIAYSTLRIGDMSTAVELPRGQNISEWLAVNTIEFFNEISLIFGCLTEFCTPQSCPTMSAGAKYEYLWAESNSGQKPIKVPACQYIDFLMTWVEGQIHNETIFPSQLGVPFPENFEKVVKMIFKRLFRIYGHIYYSHFQHIRYFEAEPHLNTSFKHFIYFVDEFNLIDDKELVPLAELIVEFKKRRPGKTPN